MSEDKQTREMRRDVLDACAAYYRSIHREMTPTEQALLLACVTSIERERLGDLTLQSLDTDDGTLAAALKTLVGAIGAGHRTTPPLTLRRALGTPDATLPLLDESTGERLALVTDRRYAILKSEGASPTQSLVMGDTGLRLTASVAVPPLPARHIPSGCIVSLMTLPRTDEMALARLRAWLDSKTVRSRVRRLVDVPRGLLLARILSLGTGGIQLDLGSLCPAPDRTHEAQLGEVEGYLLVSPQNETHALLESARELGLVARAFGKTNGSGALSISERDAIVLSLPLRFLHTLDRPRTGVMHHTATDTPPCPALLDVASERRPADGWQRADSLPADTPVTLGAWTVLHVTVVLDRAVSHRNVTDLLARAAVRLCAAGGDFDTLRMCTTLSLHPDRSPRPAFLAAMGLRTLTEAWGIPLAEATVTAHDGDRDTLTVCLLAKTLPCTQKGEHRVLRLLATPFAEDGSTPLATLATVLRAASRALRKGQASAPVAWVDRAVCEGLAGLANGTVDDALASAPEAALPQLGLLVCAAPSLTEGVRLGEAVEVEDEPIAPTSAPRACSAVHVAQPTVLMPVPEGVDEPTALIEPLIGMGATVHILPCRATHEDLTALADAIAACDILVLNGESDVLGELLAHRRVAHAMGARLPDHATLALLHRAAALPLPEELCPREACRLRRLPEGLTRQTLSEMVKYYQ